MSCYEHLPLFENAYEFDLYFVKLSRGFPKDYKYGIAVEIRELCLKVIDNIILANRSTDKAKYLDKVVSALDRIKVKVRILKDLEVIGLKSYEYISKKLGEIARQTNAWQKWSLKDP